MEEKNRHEHGDLESSAVKKKLSLDDYFRVFASGDYNALSKRDLNQSLLFFKFPESESLHEINLFSSDVLLFCMLIHPNFEILSIHGFRQLKEGSATKLAEVVSAMELKDFSRSTLGECIQPAPMSLADVIKDLKRLNWQTCPVVSVRSLNSAQNKSMASSTCDPKASADPASLKSDKKKTMTGQGSTKKSDGKSGRSGKQASSVVSTRSIDSAQCNNKVSYTCEIEASLDPTGLISEKKKLQTGPVSKKKSGEQAFSMDMNSTQYSDVASAWYILPLPMAEPTRKQINSDQSGKSASSGEDNSVDQKDYEAVMIGASCNSSTMAKKEAKPANKRKRKVNTQTPYFSSGDMPNLSKELGIFP
ncbi:hypothetical protein V2J09_019217 [Rumex salicifolius]